MKKNNTCYPTPYCLIKYTFNRDIKTEFVRCYLPKHCPYRSGETVYEGCGDIPPFPCIPAGRVWHGEFTNPKIDKSEKSK